jgi:hypothetical protein
LSFFAEPGSPASGLCSQGWDGGVSACAFAAVVAIAVVVAFAVVVACPFVCHSAAQRRNLLLSLPLLFSLSNKTSVISTEADHSLIVSSAAEKSASLPHTSNKLQKRLP